MPLCSGVVILLLSYLPQTQHSTVAPASSVTTNAVAEWANRLQSGSHGPRVNTVVDFWTHRLPRFDQKKPSLHLPHIYARHRANAGTPAQFRKLIKPWIEKFGEDDYYDLRLSLELSDFFSPINKTYQQQQSQDISYEEELSEMIAEIQVLDWLRDNSKLERLVWFTVWSQSGEEHRRDIIYLTGFDLSDPAAIRTKDEFGFWWDTRKFLYLCMLTNEMQRMKNQSSTTVLTGYSEWRKAIETAARQGTFRPSRHSPTFSLGNTGDTLVSNLPPQPALNIEVIPHLPFPGQSGFPLLSPKQYRELN